MVPTSASPAGDTAPAPKAPSYDHLPDLSADDSIDGTEKGRPTFEQLNATLISRGYLRSALNVAGMHQDSVGVLADALHAMISQREEDIEVRTALTAKNRMLAASLERAKRFHKEESERAADFERKSEAAKAKLTHVSAQLEAEQNAHKATKDALARMRRDLQAIKASALQYKAANDRSVARVRARIGEVTSSAIRSAVPDFQIVASAFDDLPTSSSTRGSAASAYAQQVQELEQKRTSLVEYNQALKRLATDAINAARRADQELLDMVEAEQEDAKKRDAESAPRSAGTRSTSSGSLSSHGASSRKASTSDAWLEGHRPLFQRDLFPATDSLRSTSSGMLVSASSSKALHPALRALELTSTAISTHVQSLLDLRTERNIHQATANQRFAAELKEQAWVAQLEHGIHEDLRNDARLSLNKANGPVHVGSLASAAAAASSGTSAGGTSQRIDWQREKSELEKKLAQLVKQLAVAEQNAARKDKEVRKLAEAEQRARNLLDQAAQPSSPEDTAQATQSAEIMKRADALRIELQAAEQARVQLAQRCNVLEAEAQELRNERDRVLADPAAPSFERGCPEKIGPLTSLKRLADGEVAEIHARDAKRRSELGSLSVVAEDAETAPASDTVSAADAASEEATSDGDGQKGTDDASGALSFGESLSNNPELGAIFGGNKWTEPSKSKPRAAPRRSSRLSGGGTTDGSSAPAAVEYEKTSERVEGRKRKADREEQANESSSTGRRTSSRVSTGSSDSKEASPRSSKRPRPEADDAAIAQPRLSKPAVVEAAAEPSRRRMSTREKQELDEQRRSRAVSSLNGNKTPALTSRRVVSASSSSVTRPTAASLRRSEGVQGSSVKRPLSNATNTREAAAPITTAGKAPARAVLSSSSARARS
ncbi:hypothetical protein PaG_01279 [Moesziomyces aphidis]|uniref:Uncharacterized protein n=1 Tax=Moesziomyces aphidis TaxID=84754 RepID=W3VSA5_MOEAP|nr:hypothetical protein PaG_01279 [Moesziomyces aphidis]